MSVTEITSQVPFRLTLSVPAEVEGGEVVLTEENFVPVGTGAVQTVFGRTGAVVAVAGDYAASEVTNDSGVAGATVDLALDALAADIAAGVFATVTATTSVDIGAGAGSPTLTMDKAAAGTASVLLQAAGVTRGSVVLDADEDIVISRHDGAGVVLDSITYENSTGEVTLPGAATIVGDVDITAGLITTTAGTGAVVLGTGAGSVTCNSGLVMGAATTVDLSAATSLTIPADSPLNVYYLTAHLKDIISANGAVAYVAIPPTGSGEVVSIQVVADNTIAVGNLTVQAAIVGIGNMTNGLVTVVAATGPGVAASATPTAANDVVATRVLSFTVAGGNTAAGTATITVSVLRDPP